MQRKVAITGSASGIGKAASKLAEALGWQVLRVDLREGDILADLASVSGRRFIAEETAKLSGGKLDAVIACAGVAPAPAYPAASPELVVRVNYFGAVATLEGLRPLLANGNDPRGVVVSSIASIDKRVSAGLVEACLADDEPLAVRLSEAAGASAYSCSKAAVARWVRRKCLTPEWLGAGILLNAIAPAHVDTPMIRPLMQNPEIMIAMQKELPSPLGRPARANEVAELLLWLVSSANRIVAGQVIFADGGAEVALRGDNRW